MSVANGKVYKLVLFDVNKSMGVAGAMHKEISHQEASILLREDNATITCNEKTKYRVIAKRLFTQKDKEGHETLFIIADCQKFKP